MRSLVRTLALSFLLLHTTPSMAADFEAIYPVPANSVQLACNLSESRNPVSYRAWWTQVTYNTSFQHWFWNEIVPGMPAVSADGFEDCLDEVQSLFWHKAVPENWDMVPRLEHWWPQTSGGYFTQMLWQRQIPDGAVPIPAMAGWSASTGGYYEQTFWLSAVPREWGPSGYALGIASMHYYQYFLWSSAIPNNWAPGANRSLGKDFYREAGHGYYRYQFWEHAVPDGWAPEPALPGWPASERGYYAQNFWLNAVPLDWVPLSDLAIGGTPNRGYYAFWLYHFAAPRGFAWRDTLSVSGSAGASYYMRNMLQIMPSFHHEYAHLSALTNAHLETEMTPRRVDTWFDEDAEVVVVFTFDAEGDAHQTCTLTQLLQDKDVPATFFLEGNNALAEASEHGTRFECLKEFDIGNHTQRHAGKEGYVLDPLHSVQPQALFNMLPGSVQDSEITLPQLTTISVFERAPNSFRTPWCDGHRSFDGSVIDALQRVNRRAYPFWPGRINVDSSIASVPDAARARGFIPPVHLDQLSVDRFPYPFYLGGGSGILEIPFAYPSDYAANATGIGESLWGRLPAEGEDPEMFMPGIFKEVFEEIRAQNGVMVILMHPWMQVISGFSDNGEVVEDLIEYMQAAGPGVRFSTISEVAERYTAAFPP